MIAFLSLSSSRLAIAARLAIGAGVVSALSVSVVSTARTETATTHSVRTAIAAALSKNEESLIAFRRDLHRHPELAGQESRTAERIAQRMTRAGLEVRTGVGGHGVVAVLEGGQAGPVVAYRADMDAIPTTGPDPVEFRSIDAGVRHGCGHDVHVTIAVGMVEALATVRDQLRGTIVFIFQPAEENGEGAAAVIRDGALDTPKPQAIFAVHCAPLEVGTIGTRPGMLLGGLDVVQVKLSGEGDHDAATETVRTVLSNVNDTTLGTPEIDGQSDFTMAGLFQAGPAEDGDGTLLLGMVRCSSDQRHREAQAAIEAQVGALSIEGVDVQMKYARYQIPPVLNDADLVERGNAVVRDLAGPDALYAVEGVTPYFSEDFSQFQQQIPGVLYYLGVSNSAKGTLGLPHSPMFVADEGAIVFGATAMSAILVDFLERQSGAQ